MLNAADEIAVGAFLDGRIGFDAIALTVADAIERWGDDDEPDLEGVIDLDREVRDRLTQALT